jgi:predicted TIM-barrel fold metal-dependent hydrolase
MSQKNRRSFLKMSAMGIASLFVKEPGRGHGIDAAEPAHGTIIDTHTHFYDPTRPQGVPWPPKEDKLLYRRVLPEDFQNVTKSLHVTGTVVVEASAWVEDNDWVLDLAARNPVIVGLVGRLAPGTPAYGDHLKRLVRNRLFRGLRLGAGELKKGLGQDRFIEDLKLLRTHDLELDVLGGPDMLTDIARLGLSVPELRIVINHVAGVPIDSQAPPQTWLDGMRAAAKNRHVYCKVSGLVEATGRQNGDAPKEVRFYKPVLDALWDVFGEDRLIYGSNWPVSERFAPYATVLAIVAEYFRAKGDVAKEKFFWRNARTVYQWVQR